MEKFYGFSLSDCIYKMQSGNIDTDNIILIFDFNNITDINSYIENETKFKNLSKNEIKKKVTSLINENKIYTVPSYFYMPQSGLVKEDNFQDCIKKMLHGEELMERNLSVLRTALPTLFPPTQSAFYIFEKYNQLNFYDDIRLAQIDAQFFNKKETEQIELTI